MHYLDFELDPFQEKAIQAVNQGKSLIVAAPTGCGKTLIADYAVDVSLKKNQHIIYTAPIKALSNQKFRDFRHRFGEDIVGIHTGDVTMNPAAPLLIMTTEIFRNLILERSSRLDKVFYAIFDEIHYLDDPERGTVWEECIILAPSQIHFICLSATVPNINELGKWMEQVRDQPFEIIEEKHRPVPLRHYLFSSKYGEMTIKGVKNLYCNRESQRKKFLQNKPSSKRVLGHVLQAKRFPVLYFCFNRRSCERNAELHSRWNLLGEDEYQRIVVLIDELIAQYKLTGYDKLDYMRQLWESGCAYHHAGILPAAKEIVERLFTTGLIKLLFCTETFALGINMPASTVIFDELEKFNGVEFRYLMTRQYNQMAGRAGRRGMDAEGYVYSLIVPEATDPKEIERLFYGPNESINSRFIASYSTILNLYSQFGEGSFDIFRRSLRNYKQGNFTLTKSYQKEEIQIRNRIAFLQATGFLEGTKLTDKGRLAASVNGYEIQAAQLYYTRSFDICTPEQLPVVLGALVTEENNRNRGQRAEVGSVTLRFEAEKVIHNLRKLEIKYGIATPVRELCFSLSAPIFAWAGGCTLRDLLAFGVPEGDLIRVLRMTIQLMRTLRDILPDSVIADRMHQAVDLVNRDVVDAQAELEVG